MISSERRVEANRRNAKKSTGPRSETGKEKSKRNALKHGLRAAVVVPEDEDQKALDGEVAAWVAHYEPGDPVESALVRRGALASVRLERCGRQESARLEERRRNAVRRWYLDRKIEVEALADRLPIEPGRVAPALRATPEGCSWLMARWRLLRVALASRGHWTIDELSQALHLLGRSEQPHRRELATCRLTAAHLAAESGRSADRAAAEGLLSAEQGREWLDRKIARESLRLREARAALRADRRRDVAQAADRVLFDASPVAALMRRYEAAAMVDLGRCVTLLARLRAGDRPGPRVIAELEASTIEANPSPVPASTDRPETPEIPIVTATEPAGSAVATEAIEAPNEPIGAGVALDSGDRGDPRVGPPTREIGPDRASRVGVPTRGTPRPDPTSLRNREHTLFGIEGRSAQGESSLRRGASFILAGLESR